jgi:hypothetical protein
MLMVWFIVATECAHRSKVALNGVGEEKLEEELMRKGGYNPCCDFAGLVSSSLPMKTL